jgi:hypothetical protein
MVYSILGMMNVINIRVQEERLELLVFKKQRAESWGCETRLDKPKERGVTADMVKH